MSGTDDRPNILCLMTDQHCFRALGCADHPDVETPNIDSLANRGVQFTDAYCPSPVCGPARGSLFSGHYPENSGVNSNGDMFDPAIRGRLLPRLLRQGDYDTALAGKLHFTPINADYGFNYKQLHDAPYDCYRPEEP